MLTYNALKAKAREFLAATGLKIEEFARLLPAFESAYHALYPLNQTAEGKTRQRLPGAGPKEPGGLLKTNCCSFWFIKRLTRCKPCTGCSLGSVNRRPTIGFIGCCPCCSAHGPI